MADWDQGGQTGPGGRLDRPLPECHHVAIVLPLPLGFLLLFVAQREEMEVSLSS